MYSAFPKILLDNSVVFMDFVKCSKYKSVKSCCSVKSSMDDENENNGDNTFPEQKNKFNVANPVNRDSLRIIKNERYNEYSKLSLSWATNKTNSMYRSSELPYGTLNHVSHRNIQEKTISSTNIPEDKDFWCPRCGKSMQEPRLLPCLHPICSPCVSELMSRSSYTSSRDITSQSSQLENGKSIYYEVCPLCDSQLPNVNSPIPPPHYPLQHRLVMSAVRSFANKILCDVCADEIIAVVQCSTCLRNFCLDCGMVHQQQVTMELRPSKHLIKPLWEATKVRRTALCQKHPTHALRFYCIACQQVTCKECMWSNEHRGHASEISIGAAKRVTLYLMKMLQRAKILLNMLLTQYDRNVFLNGTIDETKDISFPINYRYVKLKIFLSPGY